jgi:cysteine desulfurase
MQPGRAVHAPEPMHPVYLDHAATTPVRAEVRDAMMPFLGAMFGNPSSSHRWGREARAALEQSRERLAAVLGARRSEIVFTACGTDSDNIAVLGAWRASGRPHAPVACSAIEHKAVLLAAKAAHAAGAPLILLGVDRNGHVDEGALDEALAARPAIVSVMWGNNEVGALQPVARIADRCRAAGIPFHTDAVQAFGKVRVRVDETPVDMLALSAHKFGGPKGTGLLWIRDGVDVEPLEFGGGQERNLHPGTQNVAGAVALATAAELAESEREAEHVRLAGLRDRLETALAARIDDLVVNSVRPRLPHILNVTVPGVDQDALVVALDLEGVAVSVASACQSGASEPSHVLSAMGRISEGEASIRLSLGHATDESDIERAIDILPRIAGRVRDAFA